MPPDRRLPAARKRAALVDRDAGAPAPVRTGVHPPCKARPPPAGRPGGAGRRPRRTPTGPTRAAPGPERRAHPRVCLHRELYVTLVTYASRVRRVAGHSLVSCATLSGLAPRSAHATPEPARHHVGPAQRARARLRRASAGPDAPSRRAGGPRHTLHQRLVQHPHLRAVAGEFPHRPLRSPDRRLGQRHALHRRRGAKLGPPAGRPRPPGHHHRQAALPQLARRHRTAGPAPSHARDVRARRRVRLDSLEHASRAPPA